MNHFTRTLFIGLFVLIMLGSSAYAQSDRQRSVRTDRSAARFESLTRSVVKGTVKGTDVTKAARERFELMKGLAETDPSLVLTNALSIEELGRVPVAARGFLETREKLAGELEVLAECEEHDGRVHRFLRQGDGRLSLFVAGEPSENLLTGAMVSVEGVRIGDTFVVDSKDLKSANAETSTVGSNVLTGTTGEKRVLVILVNFQDNSSQPYSVDHARDIVFNQGSGFVRENSYGQTWLTGDVYGWYTIPVNGASCDTTAIGNYARQAAAAAGADLSAYQHYVYGFPSTSTCGFSGRSSVGGNPSHLWINSNLMGLPVFGHEFGHSLGLFHSQSLDCGTDVIGGSCTASEYGDVFDIMGVSRPVHMNAYQKERLGWLNAGASPPIQTVSTSGTFVVDAYETGGSNVKSLKILKSIDPATGYRTYYYLEHRTPTGFDSSLGPYGVQNGILVHTGSDSYGTENYLLDMTPATVSWYDPTINVGQSFTDNAAGLTFTVLSVDNLTATVQITMNAQPCVRANPTVSVTPGQSYWMSAGSMFVYQVSITNNNSGGCASDSFGLSASLPNGLSASFPSPALSLANGANGVAEVYVSSSLFSSDGVYNFGVAAANASNAAYSASGPASYVLVSGLGVTASPGAAKYSRSQTASVTATVSAAGSPVASTSVTFTMTKPGGATVTQTVLSGSDGRAVFTYKFNRKSDPTGTYQVTAAASVKTYSGQGSTSFLVNK